MPNPRSGGSGGPWDDELTNEERKNLDDEYYKTDAEMDGEDDDSNDKDDD